VTTPHPLGQRPAANVAAPRCEPEREASGPPNRRKRNSVAATQDRYSGGHPDGETTTDVAGGSGGMQDAACVLATYDAWPTEAADFRVGHRSSETPQVARRSACSRDRPSEEHAPPIPPPPDVSIRS
jgi:hypothetical protein